MATLQGLISTLEGSIAALNRNVSALASRVAALEEDASSPQPTPTQTPVVPTPTTVPDETPVPAPTTVPGETPVPTATPAPQPTPSSTPSPVPRPSPSPGAVPESPSNQRYAWEGSTIVISWDGVAGANYYNIYYDDFFDSNCRLSSGRLIFCEELATNIQATSYTHTSPDEDDNYYWVVACNGFGCSQIDSGNPAQFIDTSPDTSPENVRVSQQGSSMQVSWDAVSGATHYKVYHFNFEFGPNCSLLSGIPHFCRLLDGDVKGTTYTHSEPDDRNYYWMVACNSGGCSDIDSDNPAASHPPSSTSAFVVDRTSDSITAEWSARRGAHYDLQRRTFPESGYSLVQSALTGNEYLDDGLSPNATYYYKIRACNEVGCSDFSSEQGGITESDGPVDIPDSPTSIQGIKVDVPFSTDFAIVTWDAVQGATYYEVYRNSRYSREMSAPQTRYEDHGADLLLGFTGGIYTVKACNKAGCSDTSSGVAVH